MKETGMQFVGNIPYQYYHKGLSHRNTHTDKNAASLKGNDKITHKLSPVYNLAVFSFFLLVFPCDLMCFDMLVTNL